MSMSDNQFKLLPTVNGNHSRQRHRDDVLGLLFQHTLNSLNHILQLAKITG